MLIGMILLAILATAVVHIWGNLVLPTGLLFGALFLCGIYTFVASYVEATKDLHAEELENRAMLAEMETARRTQERILPKSIPSLDRVDLWGMNLSSRTVSGDYFDLLDLGGQRPLLMAIADVSGKGLPASLLMSNVQAGLHSHTYLSAFNLEAVALHLNRLIYENTDPQVSVTLRRSTRSRSHSGMSGRGTTLRCWCGPTGRSIRSMRGECFSGSSPTLPTP